MILMAMSSKQYSATAPLPVYNVSTMFKGFRDFILRGNVVDLAVGIVIGAAFSSVVQGFVKDLITPFIAAIVKQPNFSAFTFTINGSQFMYGDFINLLIAFLIDAATIYFLVMLPVNKVMNRFKGPAPEVSTKTCDFCKMGDLAKDATRCPHCTSVLSPQESDSREIA